MVNANILIVDDEKPIRTSLEHSLTYAGYKVDTAMDGWDALEKIKAFSHKGLSFDVVLLDMQMPDLNGPELIEQLILHNIKQPHIIPMAGMPNRDTVDALTKHGCGKLLEKPFTRDELLGRITSILGNS